VRAVATSAVRESNNREEIVRRARDEAGLDLEVVTGREEARLICLGVLHGKLPNASSLLIDIGGGSTEVASAIGERPTDLNSVPIGAVRLTEIFDSASRVSEKKVELMRRFAEEAFRESLPEIPRNIPKTALGSSGTINAVVSYAAASGTAHATQQQIRRAVDRLANMTLSERRKVYDPKRAEIIVGGAIVLETAMRHLKLQSILAVGKGLRDGLLLDLQRRVNLTPQDSSLADAALAMGHRFGFDEPHAQQSRRLSLTLFDALAPLHKLPASSRSVLEVAALLHDIGHAINAQKHHKHSAYLIQNADLPGITERERDVMALVARFHRRTVPERSHEALANMTVSEVQTIRKLSTILRIADSLDRSHMQPVRDVKVMLKPGAVIVRLATRAPIDLELWDVEKETPVFRRIFGRRIEFVVGRS
jgi:exopolyphosphatase/guanosine-5'-triphosphate,3'-diphosphate pyrophosphatase